MARLPNTATREERRELHRAKMAGKKYDREREAVEITESMTDLLNRRAIRAYRAAKRRQDAALDELAKLGQEMEAAA